MDAKGQHFFLYPAIMPGVEEDSEVPVLEVRNITLRLKTAEPHLDSSLRFSKASVLEVVNDDIEGLLDALPKAKFSKKQEEHMLRILMKNKGDLLQMFALFQEGYDALRKKRTAILQEDVDPLMKECQTVSKKFQDYFPSSVANVRTVLFPDYMGDKRPLDPKVSRLLATIEKEIDDRKDINHNETVMAYGNVLAQKYFDQICQVLPQLINLKKIPFSKQEIDKWLDEVNVDRMQMRGITTALVNLDPNVEIRGLKAGNIWELTYSLVRQIYQERGDNEAKTLLLIYTMKLDEQGNRCPAGGIGRNFEVLVKAYKLLIEQNSK